MNRKDERKLLEEIIRLVKLHSSDDNTEKVVKRIDFSWTQVAYGLSLNGYTIEYKDKPKVK